MQKQNDAVAVTEVQLAGMTRESWETDVATALGDNALREVTGGAPPIRGMRTQDPRPPKTPSTPS